MKKIVLNYCLAIITLAGVSQEVMAACTLNGNAASYVAPLRAANITVGRDVPLGSVIYQQFVQVNSLLAGSVLTMRCPANETIKRFGKITVNPLPLSKWNTGTFAGKVYETGVPGIGVVFYSQANGGFVLPGEGKTFIAPHASFSMNNTGSHEIYLIKISNTVGTGTIRANRLPSYSLGFSHGGVESVFFSGSISGSINVVSRTCETPNVEVPMGAVTVDQVNQDKAPWVDFSISLKNCPAFYGTWGGGWGYIPESDPNAPPANYKGFWQPNTIRVSLRGTVPPADANQGILALNPASSGPVASGVWVQVADIYNTPIRLVSGYSIDSEIYTQEEEGRTYTIPLTARYRKTSNTIKPGKANATAEFTIIYP